MAETKQIREQDKSAMQVEEAKLESVKKQMRQ